ncbi:hypothetical protein ACHQM5_012805 [Ranunculus cassubicifolius]
METSHPAQRPEIDCLNLILRFLWRYEYSRAELIGKLCFCFVFLPLLLTSSLIFLILRLLLIIWKSRTELPQRGGEVNLTLGGIDLNSAGSVVVREDKKLLTVLFPDGREGRGFTLKAESSEDLYEWKAALEQALAQAPNAALVMGHGIYRNDTSDTFEGSFQQWRDKHPIKSLVVGRPILLALEDIDGSPSFLEKHVLRELPSSPVPASCCTALLEAYRIDTKTDRVNALRSAIFKTFPEPNLRLLQRVLKMMYNISSHSFDNRMTPSAVAVCMAPLLLRPLLAGECELDDDFDGETRDFGLSADNSDQLLAAASSANNAQAIITTLLEEYEHVFQDFHSHACSRSVDSQMESAVSEELTDDEHIQTKDISYHDAYEVDPEVEDDPERVHSGKLSEISGGAGSDLYDNKACIYDDLVVESPKKDHFSATSLKPQMESPMSHGDSKVVWMRKSENCINRLDKSSILPGNEPEQSIGDFLASTGRGDQPPNKQNGTNISRRRSNFWGSNNARKSPSVAAVDLSGDEELAIQRLELEKKDLLNRISKEVTRLQEQLQGERDLRSALELGLGLPSGKLPDSRGMTSKTRVELEEIALAEADVARLKQKVTELHGQLNQQRQQHYGSLSDASNNHQHAQNLHAQLKFLQQDFDMNLAFCNQDRKQRTGDSSVGADWRSLKAQILSAAARNSKQLTHITTPNDLRIPDAPINDLCTPVTSTSRVIEENQIHLSSSTLVDLTRRLDFFKERRSELIQQLDNLNLGYASSSFPPWS